MINGEHLEETEIVELVASWLGMMADQVLELRKRLVTVRFDDDGGYGQVSVEYRNRSVFRIDHQIQGKPRVYKQN